MRFYRAKLNNEMLTGPYRTKGFVGTRTAEGSLRHVSG